MKGQNNYILVTECYSNLIIEVFNKLGQLELKWEKNFGIQKSAKMVENQIIDSAVKSS